MKEAAVLMKPVGVMMDSVRKMVKLSMPEDLSEEEEKPEKKSQAVILLDLASRATLLHDDLQEPFACFEVQGHFEIRPMKSKFFRRWLRYQYFRETGKSPNNEAVSQALGVLEGRGPPCLTCTL